MLTTHICKHFVGLRKPTYEFNGLHSYHPHPVYVVAVSCGFSEMASGTQAQVFLLLRQTLEELLSAFSKRWNGGFTESRINAPVQRTRDKAKTRSKAFFFFSWLKLHFYLGTSPKEITFHSLKIVFPFLWKGFSGSNRLGSFQEEPRQKPLLQGWSDSSQSARSQTSIKSQRVAFHS